MGKLITITLKKQPIINDLAAECNVLGRTMDTTDELRLLAGYIATPDDNDTKPLVARGLTEGWQNVKMTAQRYLCYGRTVDDNRLEAFYDIKNEDYEQDATDLMNDDSWEQVTTATGGTAKVYNLGDVTLEKGVTYKFSFGSTTNNFLSTADLYLLVDDAAIKLADASTSTYNSPVETSWVASKDFEGSLYLRMAGSASSMRFENATDLDIPVNLQSTSWGEFNLTLDMPQGFNLGVTSSITAYAHRAIMCHAMYRLLLNQEEKKASQYLAEETDASNKLLLALNARTPLRKRQSDWM